MKAVGLGIAGAVVSVLAFPPFGPGWLIVIGITLFLLGLRLASSHLHGLLVGTVYGLAFFVGLIWWISELGLVALVPLVLLQAAFPAAYAWWLSHYNDRPPGVWLVLAVGGWAVMELIRYSVPFGGFEWGGAGNALSDQAWARDGASLIGASGWTVIVVAVAVSLVLLIQGERRRWLWVAPLLGVLVVLGALPGGLSSVDGAAGERVVIIQGSTPCPFQHCPPDERLRTYQQHLALTMMILPGEADLVVWSEGSTGGANADPVQNPEIGQAIGEQARRIGAWMLVGSDRRLSDTEWINANVVFSPDGEIVGEYRKQHPVPFGEYIPFRPLFDWIPALAQVPRDMIPGEGAVVFDLGTFELGSVVSFEGSFSRYARQHVRAGAEVIVVATNEGSYGITPASEQLIGMTRMRAAELRVPVVHSAVTGKSTVIDASGMIVSDVSGLGTQQIIRGIINPTGGSLYAIVGDVFFYIAAFAGVLMWWRARSLVSSGHRSLEEE
ncbi:MAG: apolipoprotein N-acyltransferase [Actinobacteria bacterium]|nr:apolipoprotein N-acyltransferase [Actinomycetota bacterium]